MLSRKWISLLILVLAIGSRIIQVVFFYNIRVDASYQVMAMQNFVHGHGISTAHALSQDLSTNVYQPLINWPPGYSWLLAPFYILSQHNYVVAGIMLDIFAAVTLILVSRALLKLFEIPVHLINIYTLLVGFFVYYFYFIASSDAIAITIFLIALYYTLLLLKTKGHWIKQASIISICLLFCGFIKYLFIPVIFIIPCFLIIKGYVSGLKKEMKSGLLCSLVLLIGIGTLLIYQKSISGSAAYISQPERGFYLQHLLDAYPFIPASFIKPDTFTMLSGLEPDVQGSIFRTYQIFHLTLALLFTAWLIWNLSQKGFKKQPLTTSYFYLLYLISFGVTLLLAVLSIRVAKEEILPGWLWTYIEEPRYYGLPNVMIHLGIFISYQHFHNWSSRKMKYVFGLLILLFLPEIFRGMIFDFNRLRFINKEEYSWQYEDRFQKYAAEIIKKEKQPVEKVIITGSWYYMNHRVSLYSHASILDDVHKINDPASLNTKSPVLLLVILREKDLPEFQPFLLLKKEVAGRFNDFIFYTIHVTPH